MISTQFYFLLSPIKKNFDLLNLFYFARNSQEIIFFFIIFFKQIEWELKGLYCSGNKLVGPTNQIILTFYICWQAHSRLILINHHETRNSSTQKILEERLRMTSKKEESLRRENQTMRKVTGIF